MTGQDERIAEAASELLADAPISVPGRDVRQGPTVWVSVDTSERTTVPDLGVTVFPVSEPSDVAAGCWFVLGSPDGPCRYGRLGMDGQAVVTAVRPGTWSALLLAPQILGGIGSPSGELPTAPSGPISPPSTVVDDRELARLVASGDPITLAAGIESMLIQWSQSGWPAATERTLADLLAQLVDHREAGVRLAAVDALVEVIDADGGVDASPDTVAKAADGLRAATHDDLRRIADVAVEALARAGLLDGSQADAVAPSTPPAHRTPPDDRGDGVALAGSRQGAHLGSGAEVPPAAFPMMEKLSDGTPVRLMAGSSAVPRSGQLTSEPTGPRFESGDLDLRRGAALQLDGVTVLVHRHPSRPDGTTVVLATWPARAGVRLSLVGAGTVPAVHPGELDPSGQLVLRGLDPHLTFRLRIRGWGRGEPPATTVERWPARGAVARGRSGVRDEHLHAVVDPAGRRLTVVRATNGGGLVARVEGLGIRDRGVLTRLPVVTARGHRLVAPLRWLPAKEICSAEIDLDEADEFMDETAVEILAPEWLNGSVAEVVTESVERARGATVDQWQEIADESRRPALTRAVRAGVRRASGRAALPAGSAGRQTPAADPDRERRRAAAARALRDGDVADGIAQVERLCRDAPDDDTVVIALAGGTAEPDRAALLLMRGLRTPDAPVPLERPGDTVAELRAFALVAMAAGRWTDAADTLLRLPFRDALVMRVFAECLFRAGRGDDLLAVTGVHRGRRRFVAVEYVRRGEYARAVDVLRETVAPGPDPAAGTVERLLADIERLRFRHAVVAGAALDERSPHVPLPLRPDLSVLVDAMALHGAGRTADAIRVLGAEVRARPDGTGAAHALAVISFHRAAADGAGPELWLLSAAAWALVLSDARFWRGFRARAAARYAVAVPDDAVSRARSSVEATLTDAPQRYGAPGLGPWIVRELRAARALARLGGITPAAGRPVSPGPHGVGEFGLVGVLTGRLAALPDADATELRIWFSGLGVARVLIDDGEYRQAELALADLRCERCRRPGRRVPSGVAVCAPDCPEIPVRHPGYADVATGAALLRHDARQLLAEVRTERGRVALEEGDRESALRQWTLARDGAADRPAVRRAIAEAVLVVADRPGTDDATRLHALEAYVALCGASREGEAAGRLVGELARALNTRGVERHEADPPDLPGAVEDLQRASDLNPNVVRFLLNLVVATQSLAHLRADGANELVEGMQLCIDVRARMRLIEARSEDENERAELESRITAFLDELVGRVCALAPTLPDADARGLLGEALNRLPRDPRLRRCRRDLDAGGTQTPWSGGTRPGSRPPQHRRDRDGRAGPG